MNSDDLFKKNVNRVVYSAGELILFDNYRKVGLVLESNPECLRVLDETNRSVHVRTLEVSRKVVVNPRSANCIDCENNVISRMTYVKVKDKASPMRGQMGEIRQLFKNTLFLWMKSPLLTHSNGFYCTQACHVINAGAQHLKEANRTAGLAPTGGDCQANPDRQIRDREMRNAIVIVTKGPLKGLKGQVTFANETHAEVHILSRNQKVMMERALLQTVYGDGGMHIRTNASLPM